MLDGLFHSFESQETTNGIRKVSGFFVRRDILAHSLDTLAIKEEIL